MIDGADAEGSEDFQGRGGRGAGVEVVGLLAVVDDECGALRVDIHEDTVEAIGSTGEGAEGLGGCAVDEGLAAGEGLGEEGAEGSDRRSGRWLGSCCSAAGGGWPSKPIRASGGRARSGTKALV